ncbi:drug/metabolite transporter (DMT)-like permease [Silvimonas terrae]|uniref:Drug/metabolite transporter (DMT)-like permease n=1 Tax=Silvimonas terrae TaxID=300266 RepID=A0A840RAQ1_9NEIS|nr:DMT family transporter [Silvimonas terrae]MBB5189381.1 drug/metabolite transporter (DMT)-like permease [Silvimonas terrae]
MTPSATTIHPLARFAPLGAVLIWSGNTIVSKAAATQIDPASITFYRWLLAVLVMTPFVLPGVLARRASIARSLPKLAVLGGLGMALYQGLAYVAAHHTSAVNMSVMLMLAPLLSAVLAGLLAHEGLPVYRLVGALVSFGGVIVLVTHGQPAQLLHGQFGVGDVWMLVAVTSNVIYGILYKRWAIALPTWTQLYVQASIGALLVLPFWLAGPMTPLAAGNAPLVLYAGTAASLGAPFCWMQGIRALGVARTSLFLNLLPMLVALLACLLLGEHLYAWHAVGGLIAFAGVVLGLGLIKWPWLQNKGHATT